MTANTYIVRLLMFVLLTVFVVVGVNYLVDPYAITGAKRIDGLNQYKADINDYTHLSKRYQPLGEQYNTLVVGNSRVEMGIDPKHHCFVDTGLNVYNLGMPGADVRTQLSYALNIIYQQPIETVFLSVDFIDFIDTEQNPEAAVSLLGQTTGELKYLPSGDSNPAYYEAFALDYYKSLFSLDALVSSVRTLLLQNRLAPDREYSGFNPARDFAAMVSAEGPRALFDQKMQKLQTKYDKPWFLRNTKGELGPAFADLDEFLQVLTRRDIDVVFFTHPFHESYWQLMREQGLQPLYLDWQASLVALVKSPLRPDNHFWDFAEDSPYIHEVVSEAGVRAGPLQWFWEPAHYRAELGNYMVDAMLSQSCSSEVQFGRQVF